MSVLSFLAPVAADLPWTAGDACGCPDDRCIGYHHDSREACACVDVFLHEWLCRLNAETDLLWHAADVALTLTIEDDHRLDEWSARLDHLAAQPDADDVELAVVDARADEASMRALADELEHRSLLHEHNIVEALRLRVIDAIYANVGGM